MRSITPSTPFVQSTTNTIVTNSSHSTLHHTILPTGGNDDDTLSNTTASPTMTNTPTKFLSMSKRNLLIMIILSLLLPLVGVYCMSVFHPWIDWVGGALLFCSSEDNAASSTIAAAAVHVDDGDGASFNGTAALVKKDYMLHHHSAASNVEEERTNGQFSSCPSFVEHHVTSNEVTPRQVDGMEDYDIVAANDDKDGVGDDGVPHEEEEGTPSNNDDAHTSSSSNDDDDVICINCHALFRIHVDVSYLSSTAAAVESSSVMNTTTQEKKNWFITLRDVTYDNDELVYVYQMDRPLDLHCGSSATAAAVHRSNDDVLCDHSSSSNKGGCNNNTNHNSHVYLQKKCQSTAIIEVPYTSFSSSSRYNSSNYHEVTNERIILVSLLREWSSSSSQSSEVIMMAKKRRIVDQWMINIVVPTENGGGRRGSVVHSSSIHSAKLRDMVKYDSIVSKELSKESEAFTGESSSSSSSSSSSTMNEVIIACLVGVLCGLAILAVAFKFVLPQDDDDEEEEEELMTTPGILALQHAIRGSNSFERSDDGEAESPHQQQQQQSPQYYESNQDRTPSEEQLEAWSAIEQSTPTNLSPLFDDEAETIERASNHHDESDGTEIDDTIQEQAEGFEEVDESRHDDDDESEVEGSIQDQSEEDTHVLDEDEAATEMIGEDEETPPTSNKTNKRSTAPRRNSFDDIIQEQNESTAISSPLFYSPKYQSNETAPLPHSNTSSVYDQVEHVDVDGVDSNPTTSVEPAIMLLSNRAETNQPPIDYRSEWNEFGAFVHDREVLNADDNKAAATCAGTEEETINEAKDDPALSGVSKRLFTTSKQTADEVEKALSIHEEVDEVATASSIHKESEEVDESMFLPNVNVQAEANASPPNFQEQRNIPAEAITSPPKLHSATMESNAMATLDVNPVNKPTASSDVLAESGLAASIKSPNVDKTEADGGSPTVDVNSQPSINLQSDSPAEMVIAANASATSNKSPHVSSPTNKAYPTLKSVNTPPTAPMSSSKEDDSPVSYASAASFTKASVEKSSAKFDPNDASSTKKVAPGNLGNTSSITAAQQLPASPSPESHLDLSYVNQSLSLSSSPSVTSPPRKSNSPSVTSDPRFSPSGWNNSDNGSNGEGRQRKRRSLPFVSREDTSRSGKENASSNSRTPLSAKASKYSPSSTVAATVAEFAVPRTSNGLAWRAERPVPVPSGGAGQNKRLGGSPEHFEPRDASTSNDEAIDFMNGADLSSQNHDSEPNGSSRSGKRSRSSKGSEKNTSRKRKTKVEKKLLATIKTSDKHKPPSGLSSLSQRLNEEMWEHSQSQSSSAMMCE